MTDPRNVQGTMQVFVFALSTSPARLVKYRQLLGLEEIERAERFRLDVHRTRYIVAHATLRRLLAARLGCEPQELAFERGPFGKPRVTAPSTAQHLHFSLSRSGDCGVVAVAMDLEIGVDVELLRPLPDARRVADRFFTRTECAALAALSDEDAAMTFLRVWSHKEAVVKSIGIGLSQPLDAFDVPSGHLAEPHHVALVAAGRTLARWLIDVTGPDDERLIALATTAPVHPQLILLSL